MSFNHLLSQLSKQDLALLEPHIEAIELPYRMPLERRNMIVSQVYFIEAGIASVVATGSFGSNKQSIEVGLIGREGMTGLGVVLGGNKRAVHETFMQVAGSGQRISADNLRQVIAASRTLRQPLLAYAHTFLIQASTTALSNGRSKLEERLACWLLLAHDRIDGDDIKLTHELLGVMLGSHRPGVTLAVQALENRGLIAAHRGYISILDREALEKEANGTYVPPEL